MDVPNSSQVLLTQKSFHDCNHQTWLVSTSTAFGSWQCGVQAFCALYKPHPCGFPMGVKRKSAGNSGGRPAAKAKVDGEPLPPVTAKLSDWLLDFAFQGQLCLPSLSAKPFRFTQNVVPCGGVDKFLLKLFPTEALIRFLSWISFSFPDRRSFWSGLTGWVRLFQPIQRDLIERLWLLKIVCKIITDSGFHMQRSCALVL